jgi:hypothetical protein
MIGEDLNLTDFKVGRRHLEKPFVLKCLEEAQEVWNEPRGTGGVEHLGHVTIIKSWGNKGVKNAYVKGQ